MTNWLTPKQAALYAKVDVATLRRAVRVEPCPPSKSMEASASDIAPPISTNG